MLPTTGFFKDIDCPYYEKSCVRPYCHFRHRKRSQEPPSPTEVPTYKPTPKSELASTRSHIPISYVPDLVVRSERSSRFLNLSDRPTYKPTPISFLSAQNVSRACEYKPVSVQLDGESKEEIDLADLSTEFDLIDEILGDDDLKDSSNQYKKGKYEDKYGENDLEKEKGKHEDDRDKCGGNEVKREKSKYEDGRESEVKREKGKHEDERNKHGENELKREKNRHENERKKGENDLKDKDGEKERSRNRDKEKLHGKGNSEKRNDSCKSRSNRKSSLHDDEKTKTSNKEHSEKLKNRSNNCEYNSSDSETDKRLNEAGTKCKYRDSDSDSSERERKPQQKTKNKYHSSESSESEQETAKDKYKSRRDDEEKEKRRRDRNKAGDKEKHRSYKDEDDNKKYKNRDDSNKDKNRDKSNRDKNRDDNNKDKNHDESNKDKNRDESNKNKNRDESNKDKYRDEIYKDKNHDESNKDKFNDENKSKNREKTGSSKNRNSDENNKSKSRDENGSGRNKNRDLDDESNDCEKNSKKDNYKSKRRNSDYDKSNSSKSKHKSRDESSDRESKKGEKHKTDKKHSSRNHESEEKNSDRESRKSDKHKSRNRESEDRDGKKSKDRDKNKGKDSKGKERRDRNRDKHKKDVDRKSESDCVEQNSETDFVDEINFDFEDVDMEMDSVEAECYKIFNEYTPPVVEEKYEPVSIKSPETEPVPYNPTSKKRIAYEKATEPVSKITFSKPKAITSASLAMMNRLKLARQAQAGNDYKDLLTEMNSQNLKRKASESVDLHNNKRFAGDDNSSMEYEPLPLNNKRISHAIPSKSSSSKYTPSAISTSKPGNNKLRINSSSSTKTSTSTNLIDDIISGRSTSSSKPKRIAPVQNVGLIQRAKAQFDEMVKNKAAQTLRTQAQTMGKGNKRVAHVPDASLSDLPDVLNAERSKLPVNVRTRYLTMLADECVKLYVFKEDAYKRALNEELKCYEKCSVLGTYRNSAMLAINRLRKEIQEREKNGTGPIQPGEESCSGANSMLQGKTFYEAIESYILTEDELVLHGYPREGAIPGRAIITTENRVVSDNLSENQRVCCRCHKVYLVDEDGMPLVKEDCVYHPLRKRTLRGERTYLCCKSTDDTGCAMSNTHVSESNPDRILEGYQSTMDPESDSDPRSCSVYALDCEMCYTTIGLELTRVTIVDTNLKTVYESLVKPLNPIIDYNTRFSGITEDQMERTSTSILQVQANILHLCNSKTILIGHSLESDMKALKIIHSNIIDTSVMFPHKFGLPHKRALRVLASEYLRKIIQNSTDGHDSAEDALACMELVLWKVKEDMKLKGMKG